MNVIIVSNRTPDTISKTSGGLVTTIIDAVSCFKNIKWYGVKSTKNNNEHNNNEHNNNINRETNKLENIDIIQIMISDCLYKSHYGEFCNRFIWPTNHDLEKYIVLPNKETVYSNYIVNMFLSKAILYDINNSKNINPIWIHDYHHYCLPNILKQNGCKNTIVFFNHTPIASKSIFEIRYNEIYDIYKEIIKSISSDYIFFQTKKDLINYTEWCDNTDFYFEDIKPYTIYKNNNGIYLGYAPISVDTQKIDEILKQQYMTEDAKYLNNKLVALNIFINFERADYSKGILERLHAFKLFLKKNKSYVKDYQMLVSIEPTRNGIKEYDNYTECIKLLINKINKKYENSIILYNNKLIQSDVYHLMRTSNIMHQKRHLIVTSYRDGMNLTAKEFAYIADCGTLIIHNVVGAAYELVCGNKGAVGYSVNSCLVKPIVKAMIQVSQMKDEEITARNKYMKNIIKNNSLNKWVDFHKKILFPS